MGNSLVLEDSAQHHEQLKGLAEKLSVDLIDASSAKQYQDRVITCRRCENKILRAELIPVLFQLLLRGTFGVRTTTQ